MFGMVERNSELRASHVADNDAKTLQNNVRKNIAQGSTLLTDEDGAFRLINRAISGRLPGVTRAFLKTSMDLDTG